MALTGTFERTIDEKFRLAVPKPLKESFAVAGNGELFLAPGNEGCISLYSSKGFDRFARRLANISPGRANVRTFLRLFYARAERVVLDKQARIRIPDRLLNLAGLQRDVVILGVNDHAEIWDKQNWAQFLTGHSAQYDDLTTEALDSFLPESPMDR
ncbi:MAG TPA: division/cell wall cluster transcriptional repressor MraZ [Planctomycetes bacterium]|nr:division/cell wall cluster transcriptional repressor MraZ [Fuerstiella sp.]HIK91793.1 division/cell wall cluster transcriptional repressor MraZ [Planctomycetota bacterium]